MGTFWFTNPADLKASLLQFETLNRFHKERNRNQDRVEEAQADEKK